MQRAAERGPFLLVQAYRGVQEEQQNDFHHTQRRSEVLRGSRQAPQSLRPRDVERNSRRRGDAAQQEEQVGAFSRCGEQRFGRHRPVWRGERAELLG
eukprot:4654796-Prymnesium_polylepis.1